MGKIEWSIEKVKSLIQIIWLIPTIVLTSISIVTDSMLWVDIAVILFGLMFCILGIIDLKVDKKRSLLLIISGSICALANLIRLFV
ncbi:hypothetical protein [Desmospora activa]|uniref:Uncharacterized protein n=1 Tax=Desmospora activa DSM 45169 TaxID=1121389 RepID=A0A2T4ZBL9_9BACL|nr:hypothetical protein [Desmospora activa]PTM59265.1 hypothetical protein C8J48_1870 [Desmospora activa DSM 45169]